METQWLEACDFLIESELPTGAMAGTVDVIARCHTGIEMRDEVLWFTRFAKVIVVRSF